MKGFIRYIAENWISLGCILTEKLWSMPTWIEAAYGGEWLMLPVLFPAVDLMKDITDTTMAIFGEREEKNYELAQIQND